MKPIECPMCGQEMKWSHFGYINGKDGLVVKVHVFVCDCEYQSFIPGANERAARRAWNKSLIGKLRKAWKKYEISEPGLDALQYGNRLVKAVCEMFGGSDAPRAE